MVPVGPDHVRDSIRLRAPSGLGAAPHGAQTLQLGPSDGPRPSIAAPAQSLTVRVGRRAIPLGLGLRKGILRVPGITQEVVSELLAGSEQP
ncbi:MAG TPA: hypothetical protein VIX82_18900 [Solirubrobacteraceae bacterium]